VNYLIDTNVLSELRKPNGDPAVRAKLAAIDESHLFLSVVSIGEISKGIARLDPGSRRQQLEEWLAQSELFFADRVLSVDRDIAQLWGELTARLATAGRTLHTSNGLIAATALHHGLRLMTANTADFEQTGLTLINPWDS
jgi:toxin FitB